jgi:diguanylate cyclase (GGDEF)-like protein
MAAKRFDHASENRQAVHLGVGLITACSALILSTIWFLPTTAGGRSLALAVTAGSLVISVSLAKLPWERLPTEALLVFPGLGLAGMTLGASFSKGVSPAYAGLFTLAVFYVATTQSLRLTMAAVVVCLPLWVFCEGGFSATIGVRTPITLVIWVLIGHSLAQRKAANDKRIEGLVHAASTDPLTGFGSRSELARVLHKTEPGDAVVLLDLDGFKQVNDSRGHQAGDEILSDFGKIVRTVLRSADAAVRYGGDEVMLLLPGTAAGGAGVLLERLRDSWSRADRPTFSGGIAVRGEEEPTVTLLRADKCLYDAKGRGRNRWSFAVDADRTQLRVVR